MDEDDGKRRWKVSAEIIGICVTLLIQLMLGVWFLSAMNSRLDHLELITKPLADGTFIADLATIKDQTATTARRVDKIADRMWQDDAVKAEKKDK